MISYDPKQLELVTQFASFVEVLKDPKAFADKVNEAKDVLSQVKTALGNLQDKKAIDSYCDAKEAAFKKTQESLDLAKAANEKVVLDKTQQLDKREEDLKDKQSSVDSLKRALDVRDQTLAAKEKEVQSKLDQANKQLADVNAKAKELQDKEQVLNTRLATVNKLLGQ
jgi:chromosome segregation ATPase